VGAWRNITGPLLRQTRVPGDAHTGNAREKVDSLEPFLEPAWDRFRETVNSRTGSRSAAQFEQQAPEAKRIVIIREKPSQDPESAVLDAGESIFPGEDKIRRRTSVFFLQCLAHL
jgi:hypothetical protein